MRAILASMIVLLFHTLLPWAESLAAEVDNAVAKLRGGDKSDLVVSLYENPHDSAVLFSKHVSSFTDDDIRDELVIFALRLERKSLDAKVKNGRSDSTALANELVAIIEKDMSERVRATAAKGLRELFLPEIVDNYAGNIKDAVIRWKQREILVLYGLLSSCDSREVLDLASEVEIHGLIDRYAIDSVLARHGDKEAKERLVNKAQSLLKTSLRELNCLVDALSYVPSKEIKEFLTKGLRSEAMFLLTGGGKVPKRNCFANALVKMMRDDLGFPVKAEGFFYCDAELDEIEQWCATRLGLQLPDKPRPKLRVIPGIEPAP